MLSKVHHHPGSTPVASKGRIQKVRPRDGEHKNKTPGRDPEKEKKKKKKNPFSKYGQEPRVTSGTYSEKGSATGHPSSESGSEEESRIDIRV